MQRRPLVSFLVGIICVCVLIMLIVRLPRIPYNLRKLFEPKDISISILIFSAALYWCFGVPVASAHWFRKWSLSRSFIYPILVVIHGAVTWMLLQLSVRSEMINKITGSPILLWSWKWESLSRFVGLLAPLSTLITGAVIIIETINYGRAERRTILLQWLLIAIPILSISHWVVISQAATNNLTELIAGGGRGFTSIFLVLFLLIVAGVGSVVSAVAASVIRHRGYALVFVVVSMPIAYLVFNLATESQLAKYGRVFSAAQFLLSRDRDHYASDVELLLRFTIAYFAIVGLIAVTQYPFWLWSSVERHQSSDR